MCFPGFRSNNWFFGAMVMATGCTLYGEFMGVYMTPVANLLFPETMGNIKAGGGYNKQYLRFKVARDSQVPDYSKYIAEAEAAAADE